ncbi:MAG: YARHG domain-containing protein [Ruminococcus sp.]|nr:YARHG domain-containing protein [Ruminococcus sp.]
MKCPSCGTSNENGASFCRACGKPLPSSPPPQKSYKPLAIAIIAVSVAVISVVAFFIVKLLIDRGISPEDEATAPTVSHTVQIATTEPPTEPPTTTDAVSVPNVTGAKVGDAYSKLGEAGLDYQATFEYSDSVPQDYVISQTPSAATKVKKGDTVHVTISLGAKPKEESRSSAAPQVSSTSADYILPYSNSSYLTESDLAGMTRDRMELALNEIYARHGGTFKNSDLSNYFNSKSWYHGTVSATSIPSSEFNVYEKYNINFIVTVMKKLGYRK